MMQFKSQPVLDIKEISEEGTVFGYASIFGVVDQGGDRVVPGAYRKSLETKRPVRMLWQHDTKEVIGGWSVLKEDEMGLWVEGNFNMDVQRGREAHSLMKNSQIEGLSIGYRIPEGGAKRADDGAFELLELDLREISVVTMPMNEQSLAMAKAAQNSHEVIERLKAGDQLTEREFEVLFKGLSLSNSQAERAVRVNLKGQGEPVKAATELEAFLKALTE